MIFEGTLEYITKKISREKTFRTYDKINGYKYEDKTVHYDKGIWKITGPLPAMMASRIIPNAWSNERGVVELNDNPANIEHINWIMMRYALDIKSPEVWEERKSRMEKRLAQREKLEHLERPTISSAFKGTLYDFQKEAIDFLKKTDGNCLIADEMGLGKGVEALAYIADEGESAFPVLIAAPLVTLNNWRKEILRFVQVKKNSNDLAKDQWVEPSIVLIRSGKPSPLPQADFYIINYDLLHKRKEDIIAAKIKTFCLDEIQNLRHNQNLKYEAAEEISNCGTVVHRFGLSGTPMYNRGIEMYHIMNFLSPGFLGEIGEFNRIWTDYFGSIAKDRRDALYQLLRQNIMIRRRKSEVLKELPAKTTHRQQIEVDLEYYEDEMDKAMTRLQERLRTAQSNTDLKGISDAYSEFAEDERRAAGVAKVPWVSAFVENMLEIEEPVVVFAHHHVVVDLLKSKLAKYNPVLITGRESDKQKWAAESAFQNGETNLIICGLRSGNVGINLFRAHCVVFAEFDWSPSIHGQAESRLHRNGQKNAVFAYYLEGINTFDEKMVGILVNKKMEMDTILGDADIEQATAIDKEKLARELIDSFNTRLSKTGKKIDITMPDKAQIRKTKKELEKLAKQRLKESLLEEEEKVVIREVPHMRVERIAGLDRFMG